MLAGKFIIAAAAAILLSLAPVDSRADGKSGNPGQAARDCAKIAEPKEKDDCVRAAREASKQDKKGGKKDKNGKQEEKSKGKDKDKAKDKDKEKKAKKAKDKAEKSEKNKDKAKKDKGKDKGKNDKGKDKDKKKN